MPPCWMAQARFGRLSPSFCHAWGWLNKGVAIMVKHKQARSMKIEIELDYKRTTVLISGRQRKVWHLNICKRKRDFLHKRRKKKKMIGEGTYIFYREEELRRRKYWEKKWDFFAEEKKNGEEYGGKYLNQSRTNERLTEQPRRLVKFRTPHFTDIWK